MTSTNDEKDIKSNHTSGHKGKSYYIELYKSLDAQLNASSNARAVGAAWRYVHTLCLHSAPSTHHLIIAWIQKHCAQLVLQSEWQSPKSKEEHTILEEALDIFLCESQEAINNRNGYSIPWENELRQRAVWFKNNLAKPWDHPVLRVLLDPRAEPPSTEEILGWLKVEGGVMFVARLRQLAASKCDDLATNLASAVMNKVRAEKSIIPDIEQIDDKEHPTTENNPLSLENTLRSEAGFSDEVWDLLTDIELVLLHKSGRNTKVIDLAKQAPLNSTYQLVERLQSRLEVFPKEKKLWKNAKDVAILVTQVVIARCMVIPECNGSARGALYWCARALARLLPAERLPHATATLAAPAATARHLHTFATAVHAQQSAAGEMKPFVCELYVRAITFGMNELEKHKLTTEKEKEARALEQTLASWFVQLGQLLGASARMRGECALTAFSVHPSAQMYERVKTMPMLPPVARDTQEEQKAPEATSEFGSWATDSRSQTNFVKTSETLNLKHTQQQANVLSTAILNEGEALGLSAELCQDIAVLLSGPRVKTLSWDMDRAGLLENCRVYMERTDGGTRALTTELKYLNLDLTKFQHLPEEEDDENNIYYGIEKGYEHHIEFEPQPEQIWQNLAWDNERTESADSSSNEYDDIVSRSKKKIRHIADLSGDDCDPLSLVAEVKRSEKKKERPHSKERSKESIESSKKPKSKDLNEAGRQKERSISKERQKETSGSQSHDSTKVRSKSKEKKEKKKEKKERKKKKKGMAELVGLKVANFDIHSTILKDHKRADNLYITDSDYYSQGKSSLNSEENDIEYDGQFSMDELKLKSPDRSTNDVVKNTNLSKNFEMRVSTGRVTINSFSSPQKTLESKLQISTNVEKTTAPSSSTPTTCQVNANKALREQVKQSINKLMQFRKQKQADAQKNAVPNQTFQNTHTDNFIRQKPLTMSTLVGSKIMKTSKITITKKHTEQLHALKTEGTNKTAHKRKTYSKNNGTCSRTLPFDVYRKNLCKSQQTINQRMQPQSLAQQSQMPEPTRIVAQDLTIHRPGTSTTCIEPQRVPIKTQVKADTHLKSYEQFLKELHTCNNAGLFMSEESDRQDERERVRREIRPVSRVTPIVPHIVLNGASKQIPTVPSTSSTNISRPQIITNVPVPRVVPVAPNVTNIPRVTPTPTIPITTPKPETITSQSAKLHQKKAENAPHTFARLSYLHKNKQGEKPKQISDVTAQLNQQISAELDKRIADLRIAKILQYKTDLVVNRHASQTMKNNPKVEVQREPTTNTTLSTEHKIISDMLKNNNATSVIKKHNSKVGVQQKVTHWETPRTIITTPSKASALSERDQQDLLLLLRQQSKMNATRSLQNEQISNKFTNTLESSAVPKVSGGELIKHIQSVNKAQTAEVNSTVVKSGLTVSENNTSNKSNITTLTKVRRPQKTKNTPVSLKVSNKHEDALEINKSSSKKYSSDLLNFDNVIKQSRVNSNESNQDWTKVLDALRAQKTPSRGPSAVDVFLRKDSFEKRSKTDTIITTNTNKSESVGKVPNTILTVPVVSQNKPVPKSTIPTTSDRENQTTIKKTELPPAKGGEKQNNQFEREMSKEVDPFISGIPNSDYEILEELMDDDLRQEIGELLSEEESFPPTFSKGPKINASIKNTNSNIKSVALKKPNLVCKSPESAQKSCAINAPTVLPLPINAAVNLDTKPISQSLNSKLRILSNDKVEMYKIPELAPRTTNVVHHFPKATIPNQNATTSFTISNGNFNKNKVPLQSNACPSNVYVTTVSQPTPNVVVLGSEEVYEPFSVYCNVNQTSYITMNTPNVNVYQPTQPLYVPPAASLLVGNTITLNTIDTNATVPANAAQRIPQNVTIPIAPATVLPKVTQTILTNLVENTLTAAYDASRNTQHNTVSPKTQVNVPAQKLKSHFDKETAQANEIIKNSQQNPLTLNNNIKRAENVAPQTSIKNTASYENTDVRDEKMLLKNNINRLVSKRLAIRNREVNNQWLNPPIPLKYAPLRPVQEDKTMEGTTKNQNFDNKTQENEKVIKEIIKNNRLTESDTFLKPYCDEISSSSTLDTNSMDSSKETTKENKESPSCRSILLRSTHKLNSNADSFVNKDNPVGKKTKVRLKAVINTTESDDRTVASAAKEKPVLTEVPVDKEPNIETEQHSVDKLQNYCDQTKIIDATVNSHPTRVSKRILNRKIKRVKEKQTKISQPKHVLDNYIVNKSFAQEHAILKEQVINVTDVKVSDVISNDLSGIADKLVGSKIDESLTQETIDDLNKSTKDNIMMSSNTTQKPKKAINLSTKVEQENTFSVTNVTTSKEENILSMNPPDTKSNCIQEMKINSFCRESVSVAELHKISESPDVTSNDITLPTENVKSSKNIIAKFFEEIESIRNEITKEYPVVQFSDNRENIKGNELTDVNSDDLDVSTNKKWNKITKSTVKSKVLDTVNNTVEERETDDPPNGTAFVSENAIKLAASASGVMKCSKNKTATGVEIVNKSSDESKENTNEMSQKYAKNLPIRQSYIDNVRFEELPFRDPKDPFKRIVRVKPPNGKVFKATIYGKANVNFDTLFEVPEVKKIFLSGLCDKKSYTLNIQQLTTQKKTLETKVQAMNIANPASEEVVTVETVNLISDDEDESPPAISFATEFGEYKTKSIAKDLFTKHQAKLLQKCSIKLNRCKTSFTSTDVIKPVSVIRNPALTNSMIGNVDLVFSRGLKDLLILDKTSDETIIPDIIQIDDSSNDSVQIAELGSVEKVTTFGNLLVEDSGIVDDISESSTQTGQKGSAKNTLVTLTQHLLNDLGIESDEKLNDTNRHNSRAITAKINRNNTKDENFMPEESESYASIMNRKYYVKLVRCDDQVKSKEILQDLLDENYNDHAIAAEDPEAVCSVIDSSTPGLSRSGSFSILNDLVFDDISTVDRDGSSPITNMFETISSLRIVKALERSSPVIEVFDMIARAQNRSKVFEDAEKDKPGPSVCLTRLCDSEWFLTKSTLRHQVQVGGKYNLVLSEIIADDTADSLTDCESDFDSTVLTNGDIEDSTYTVQVPKLTVILAKYFEDNPLGIQLKHCTKTFEVPKLATIMARYFEDNPLVILLKHCTETVQVPTLTSIMARYFENNPLVTWLQHVHGLADVGVEKVLSPLKRKLQTGEETVANKITKVVGNIREDIDVEDEIIQICAESSKIVTIAHNVNTSNVTESNSSNTPEKLQDFSVNSELSSPTQDITNGASFEGESRIQNIHSLNINADKSIGSNVDIEIDQHISTIAKETSNIIEDNMASKTVVTNAQECFNELTTMNTKTGTDGHYEMKYSASHFYSSDSATDLFVAKKSDGIVQVKIDQNAKSVDVERIGNKENINFEVMDVARSKQTSSENNTNPCEIETKSDYTLENLDKVNTDCGLFELKTENTDSGHIKDTDSDDVKHQDTLIFKESCEEKNKQEHLKEILISDISNDILKFGEANHTDENIYWIGHETEIGNDSYTLTAEVPEIPINTESLEHNLINDNTIQTQDNNNEQTFKVDHSDVCSEYMTNINEYCKEVVILNDHNYFCETAAKEMSLNDAHYDELEQKLETGKSSNHKQDENVYLKKFQSSIEDRKHIEENSDTLDSNNTSMTSKQDYIVLTQTIECIEDFDENDAEKNTTHVYKEDSDVILKGIEYEDPELGTCYAFPLSKSSGRSTPTESSDYSENVDVVKDLDHNIKVEKAEELTQNFHDEDLKLMEPKLTYKRPKKKRKLRLSEVNATAKRRKNSKTSKSRVKNINSPKLRTALIKTSHIEEYTRIIDYYSTIEFSYAVSYSKEYIDVSELIKDWPIKGPCIQECKEKTALDIDLFAGDNESAIFDPVEMTVAEEITAAYEISDLSCDRTEDNTADMGFGEGSGRVIQNLEDDGAISKFSAATLSDVKLLQPFLLSENRKHSNNANFQIENQDQLDKIRRCFNYFQLRSKVQSFFKNIEIELNRYTPNIQKDKGQTEDAPSFPFDLYIPSLPEPSATNVVVQVVQVGQLPVSAAAQNPVTCDPRVTQVSNASPSQCSLDNSPQDGSQAIKTEYTELTTAEMTLPLVQDYTQQNPEIKIEQPDPTNISMSNENIPIETEIKTEIKDEIDSDNQEEIDESHNPTNVDQNNANINNIGYSYETNNTTESEQNLQLLFGPEKQSDTFMIQKAANGAAEKIDQIAHAMNAAGITTTDAGANSKTNAFVNLLSQKLLKNSLSSTQNSANNCTKTINAVALQQALAQILPPPLNQTNNTDNNQPNQNAIAPQVLHIVQGKNAAGNQITLVDNSQPSVINTPNATPVLHIVQNKSATSGPTTNGAPTQPGNSFSGLSLVDAGLQQGGNQLLHIVNTGNQKNNNAGQLLKRVNLLTNLQGSNEQKLVQFVCKSADGKSIQLNANQRGMVLRLQPIETPNVQTTTPKLENQELSPTAPPAPGKDSTSQQEIKSRSMYEENYAKFIQNVATKTQILEKSTSLPKFNQAFGKQVFQDGTQKQNDIGNNLTSVNVTENSECTPPAENSINLDHIGPIGSPPLLLRKPTHTSQPQPMHQMKQTIAPMNIQTMHGGVIYTRQIPVNIAGGQTINLIVPSTEFDESNQKQQSDVKYQSEIEPSIIKIVPQTHAPSNTEVKADDENHPMNTSTECNQNPQPQPVLTQMRIKLPMLSKAPQMVPGARVVRPSFFQIQRNVIGGANQPVYQQLVLTAAPPLGQQTIRLPQSQTRSVKVESQTSESHMSTSTLEQLREFDMVLEQVKERSTGQPNSASSSKFKFYASSSDTTDTTVTTSNTSTETTQVLYSIGSNQPLNVAYVNRKATVSTPTTCTFVRSPDSSGIIDSPSSSNHVQLPQTIEASTSETVTNAQPKPKFKSKSRPKHHHSPKVNSMPPKASTQKPLEDEQTTQRILYILAEYKEQVENSPDKDKPAPRRRSNPPTNPPGSSKRKKSSSGSRRSDTRDVSPVLGEDTCRTMGSEDSSCGTSQEDCAESCHENQSPQDSPRKVARKLTFEPERPATPPPRPPPQQRNVIVADGQTITVARGTAGKPTAAVLMPANYILPVSMMKGGKQIAIVTNRVPKLLTVGGSESGATNALLLQRLIGPAGLKPVLSRPGVRHVRLPTAALHNLQAFNLASAASGHPPDSTASPASAHTPPELVDTHPTSSPWTDRHSESTKPSERTSSPEGSWHLPSSADPTDYCYEETVRATESLSRTVLDPIPDRYSPDMEAQRIFDKMFDVETKKSYIVDSHDESPRCGYDIDASDCDDKSYHQVVQKKDGSGHRQHRLTQISAAALRHKYAILEHELRLQKSLSEECEDLGVDSPSASELFPEAELLFANSPAHDHAQDAPHHSHTPQPIIQNQTVIQPDIDDQMATDHLLRQNNVHDDQQDLNLGLEDVGIVTVNEDGMATIALDQEEFARSHPNTTFHSEPTEDGEVQPFTITGIKGRQISTIFHANRAPATVLMTAPQTTVISQATAATSHSVKYADLDNIIDHVEHIPGPHNNNMNLSSVLVKDDGLTRFDNILTDTRELHLSNTASAIVHSVNTTQVIRRVCYDDKRERDTSFLMDEPEALIAGDDAKMTAEDSRDATLESMRGDVDDDNSSPERHAELFWESNSASERSEGRRPLDFSSDSDKCCKSPLYDTNSTDSSGVGTHMRLDSVIKEARLERSGSADGSSADDTHPPLRTYPPKRMYHTMEGEMERSLSGKTRAGERSPDLEVRRRASGRGVVKRGCLCCNGSPTPQRPKKPRQRKPTMDFTSHH